MRLNKINFIATLFLLTGALLCPNYHVSGQAPDLAVGDKAPPINIHTWIKGKQFSKFKEGTPYVVEFGATWCKPCAAFIPDLSAFTEKYSGEVEVLSVFVKELNNEPLDTQKPKYIEGVKNYVKKKKEAINYHVAVDGPQRTMEEYWINAMAVGSGIPQIFVIDKEGYIAGHFKGANQISQIEALVTSILDGSYNVNAIRQKEKELRVTNPKYNRFKPLFVAGNGGDGNDFVYRSKLLKAKGNIQAGPSAYIQSYFQIKSPDVSPYYHYRGRVQEVNVPLPKLYQLAYGDTVWTSVPFRYPEGNFPDIRKNPHARSTYGELWPFPILEVSDPSPFQWSRKSHENKWHYVLTMPIEKASAAVLQKGMRHDLQMYFGYDVKVEVRDMPCWYLKARPGAAGALKAKKPGSEFVWPPFTGEVPVSWQNAEVRDIIYLLSTALNSGSFSWYDPDNPVRPDFKAPFIDATGIEGEIDFDMTKEEVISFKSRTTNRDGIEAYLEKIGLYLERGTRPMKVVVIGDAK